MNKIRIQYEKSKIISYVIILVVTIIFYFLYKTKLGLYPSFFLFSVEKAY